MAVGEQHVLRTTRRTVLAGIAATLAPGPLVAQAQQREAMRRLGVLMANLANDPEGQAHAAALVQGLGALDWHEGGNLRIDWRWAGGDPALFERYAAELVALGPEVLVAHGSASVEALRRQTSTIPIVFVRRRRPGRPRLRREPGAPRRQHHRLQQLRPADGQQMAGDADADHPARRARGGPLQSRDRALCRL